MDGSFPTAADYASCAAQNNANDLKALSARVETMERQMSEQLDTLKDFSEAIASHGRLLERIVSRLEPNVNVS